MPMTNDRLIFRTSPLIDAHVITIADAIKSKQQPFPTRSDAIRLALKLAATMATEDPRWFAAMARTVTSDAPRRRFNPTTPAPAVATDRDGTDSDVAAT